MERYDHPFTDADFGRRPDPKKMKHVRDWMKHVLRTHANLSASRTCFEAENHALNMQIALQSLMDATHDLYEDASGRNCQTEEAVANATTSRLEQAVRADPSVREVRSTNGQDGE